MSRNIVNDHLFTDDEVDYLLQRNEWKLVEKNRKEFKDSPKEVEKPTISKEVCEHVKSLNAEDLNKELESHNLSTDGDSKEKKIRLATWMEAEKA